MKFPILSLFFNITAIFGLGSAPAVGRYRLEEKEKGKLVQGGREGVCVLGVGVRCWRTVATVHRALPHSFD